MLSHDSWQLHTIKLADLYASRIRPMKCRLLLYYYYVSLARHEVRPLANLSSIPFNMVVDFVNDTSNSLRPLSAYKLAGFE